MKMIILLIVSSCFLSCEEGPSVNNKGETLGVETIDTIACGNNQGLVQTHYFVSGKVVEYLPVNKKIRAVFSFEGNFKNILSKHSKFDLRPENDSILTIKKISENEFDLVVHKRPDEGNLLYWMIMKTPNTVFEWSWTENGEIKHEYSKTWDVMKAHPMEEDKHN